MSILRVLFSVRVYGRIYGSIVCVMFMGRVCGIGLRAEFTSHVFKKSLSRVFRLS